MKLIIPILTAVEDGATGKLSWILCEGGEMQNVICIFDDEEMDVMISRAKEARSNLRSQGLIE